MSKNVLEHIFVLGFYNNLGNEKVGQRVEKFICVTVLD